jgi:hypothetical protein
MQLEEVVLKVQTKSIADSRGGFHTYNNQPGIYLSTGEKVFLLLVFCYFGKSKLCATAWCKIQIQEALPFFLGTNDGRSRGFW